MSTSSELAKLSWSSRENCTRRWLVQRGEIALNRFAPMLSDFTSSVPLWLSALFVTGLAGSKRTLLSP